MKLSFSTSTLSKMISLLKEVKLNAAMALLIMMFLGLTEGVGLLLIIPLLGIAGVEVTSTDNRIVDGVQILFEQMSIPMSVLSVLFFYLLVMIVYALLNYIQRLSTAKIGHRVTLRWRSKFFKGLNFSLWSRLQTQKNSEIQNALTIEIRKLGNISNQLIQLFGTTIVILVYLFISASLSVKLTAIAVLSVGLLAFINRPLNRKSKALGIAAIDFNQKIQSIILEFFRALKLVKTYKKELEHQEEFEHVNKKLEEQVLAHIKVTAKTKVLFDILATTIITLYIFFAIEVIKTSTATLLLLIFIFARLLPKATRWMNTYQQIIHLMPAFDHIVDLMSRFEADPINNRQANDRYKLKKEIRFKGVDFSYGKLKVLENVSFSFFANKTNILLGASGKGKSTVIDLIMGLQKPIKGEICIDGKTMEEIDLNAWKEGIAYVPQDSFLFNRSIKKNLLWVNPEATAEELHQVLVRTSAFDFVQRLPNGIDTVVGDNGTALSGGQRQRISLARALLRKPELLILDEATSSVDDENEEVIKKALNDLKGEMTIIIVAHRSNLMDLADHLIELQ